MATIRLVPSTYAVSGTSYLTVSNESNMYANTDSTTYATITNVNASTTSRYLYLRGFNFSDIPANAVINSFTVKIKGYESGLATSTSYAPRLANGTSALSNTTATSNFGTSASTITIPTGALTWQQIVNYGSSFTIMVYVRRNNRNTTGYFYCYGAEILVDYTVPNQRTVTSTLSGSGTIAPSGAQTLYDGAEYELTITPTTKTDVVTVTNNGNDVTAQLVAHYAGAAQNASAVLGAYSIVSGGFNGSGASYFQGLVGKGHTATTTTSNYYSSGSGTEAVFQYAISFSNIPSNAVITRLYMMASGHAESTSSSSEYMCVQLKSGNTALSEQYNFKSAGTSNSTQTIEADVLPTVAQLSSLVVECTLGYYGGAINGVTVYLEYEIPSGNPDHYTYTYIVDGNATIAVVIGSAGNVVYVKVGGEWVEGKSFYVKRNGSWVSIDKVFKRSGGSWSEQDKSAMFDEDKTFLKGYFYTIDHIAMNLDGIDSYANKYQDTTSGFEGDWVYPNGITNNFMRGVDVVADGTSFAFNGTTSYMRPNASAVFDTFLYSTHTIEAYFELTSFDLTDGNAFLLYVGRNSKANVAIYAYYYGGSIFFIKSSATNSKMLVVLSLSLNVKHYIAANADGWMLDGVYFPDSESQADSSSVATNDILNVSGQYACASIGMRFKEDRDASPFNGKLYAMRIHSTKLSAAEMYGNMMCDKKRFG